MGNRSIVSSGRDLTPWLWLAIAGILAFFGNGRWLVPAATWLAPVFMLRFVHSQEPRRGLAVGALVTAAIYVAAWQGMTLLSGLLYVIVFTGIGLLFWLPYCVDRLLAPRIGGFASTLVFPLAYVSVELICILTSPFSSWGSLAYTQYDLQPLIQLVSLTGVLGIAFLITWTASVIHWAWRRRFEPAAIWRGAGLCAAVVVAVLVFGLARLSIASPHPETVRAGTVAATAATKDLLAAAEANPKFAEDKYRVVLADYLSRTRQLAKGGARIVIWDELAVRTPFDLETTFIAQGQAVASDEHIYLLMALRVQDPGSPAQARKNEAVLIGPNGDVLFVYLKNMTSPGDVEVQGDGQIDTAETSLGRLGAAICLDMDNPELIAQAGRAHTGLMLVPTWDLPAMEVMHMRMASLRAVENGFSLLRSTRDGFSAAYDSQGRQLAVSETTTTDGTMIVDVPIGSSPTLYSVIGDLLGWLCLAGLGVMTAWAIVRSKQQRRGQPERPGRPLPDQIDERAFPHQPDR